MRTKRLVVAVVLLVLSLTNTGPLRAADRQLIFSTIEGSFNGDLGEAILLEAYKRVGLQISFDEQQAKSALHLSSLGRTDGEVQRIRRIGELHPSLLRVEEPLFTLDGSVFTKVSALQYSGIDSLRGYRIAIVKGIRHAEEATKGLDVTPVKSVRQAFQMLDVNRVDVVVVGKGAGELMVQQLGIAGIVVQETPVSVLNIYHYLHTKHADLVPRVKKAIQSMKSDGVLTKILKSHYARLNTN